MVLLLTSGKASLSLEPNIERCQSAPGCGKVFNTALHVNPARTYANLDSAQTKKP
jgi:hypothetical protein